MADRQLKLYAQTTYGGTKTTTTTISNVNQQADSTTLKNFGQMLNAFTTNTYQKTDLVETTNVDTEEITTKIPGSIRLIDNPQVTTQQPDIIRIPLDSFVINNQTLTELPSTTRIFGKAYNSSTGQLAIQTENTNKSIIIDTRTMQGPVPTGEYRLMIAIDPLDQYTAATTTATITVS